MSSGCPEQDFRVSVPRPEPVEQPPDRGDGGGGWPTPQWPLRITRINASSPSAPCSRKLHAPGTALLPRSPDLVRGQIESLGTVVKSPTPCTLVMCNRGE